MHAVQLETVHAKGKVVQVPRPQYRNAREASSPVEMRGSFGASSRIVFRGGDTLTGAAAAEEYAL